LTNSPIKSRIPQVRFRRGCPSWDASTFQLIHERDRPLWDSFVKRQYPSLHKLEEDCCQKIRRGIRAGVAALYGGRRRFLRERAHEFQVVWDTVNDQWMFCLSEVLETDWNSLPDIFTAYVGFSPICPRNLADHSFAVAYFLPPQEIVRVCAHETAHFLYCRKLQHIDPRITEEEFNFPHRQWLLSEILVPVILNDPRAAQVIGESPINSYVCSKALSMRLLEAYRCRLREGLSFEGFYQLITAIELRSEDIATKFQSILHQSPKEKRHV
jgi:hypothetical protein